MDPVLARLRLALLAGGLLLLAPAMRGEAAIYVYVDEAGTTHFTDLRDAPDPHPLPAAGPPPEGRLERGAYAELIHRVAAEHRVDPELVTAIIRVESNFDPWAVSRKGAQGLMQLMPATADRYAVRNVFDPEANVRGGVRHLRELQDRFPGQLPLALAAYNAGEQTVLRYQGIPPYPETRQYIQRVLALYGRSDGAEPAHAPSPPGAEGAAAPPAAVFHMLDAAGTILYTNLPAPPPTR